MPGQPVGKLAHQHLARCGQRLQPLRRVHRVAGHRIGFGGADAQSAGDDRPGVYADVEHQWRAGIGGAFAEPRRPGDHVEGGAQRAFRIVLMRDRRTEQSEQCVADELVDETAKVLHGRGQFPEQFVLQRLHDLGVELLAECREAAKIGEQDRYGPAIGIRDGLRANFAFDVGKQRRSLEKAAQWSGSVRSRSASTASSRRTDACPTFRAELEIRCTGVAAAGAWHGLAHATLRTESEAALNLKSAARAVHRPRPRWGRDGVISLHTNGQGIHRMNR